MMLAIVRVDVVYTAVMCCVVLQCIGNNDSNEFKNGRRFRHSIRDAKFVHVHPNATKRYPGAIIVGVKKGGTRALLEFLRIHPDVRATGPEVHFFDKNYHLGFDWYR